MVPISFPHRKPADSPALAPLRPSADPYAVEGGNFSGSPGKIRGRRVLVVDDELLIRWALSEGLVRAGFEVLEAEDARSTLQQFGPETPAIDLVILDLRLPDSADLGLLRRIRELAPSTPVIMMTAYGTSETRDDALRLGACQVVSKPFDLNRMLWLVTDALGH
jgi:DNA-binding NtrC family response regulator